MPQQKDGLARAQLGRRMLPARPFGQNDLLLCESIAAQIPFRVQKTMDQIGRDAQFIPGDKNADITVFEPIIRSVETLGDDDRALQPVI